MRTGGRHGRAAGESVKPFEAMQKLHLAPDATAYNALISACEEGATPARTLELCEARRSRPLTPKVGAPRGDAVASAYARCYHLQHVDQGVGEGREARRGLELSGAMQQHQ